MTKLRTGRPLPMLELLADEEAPIAAARAVVLAMARNAYGLGSPPSADAKRDLRAAEAAGAIFESSSGCKRPGSRSAPRTCRGSRPRAPSAAMRGGEPGRVAVLDLRAPARGGSRRSS